MRKIFGLLIVVICIGLFLYWSAITTAAAPGEQPQAMITPDPPALDSVAATGATEFYPGGPADEVLTRPPTHPSVWTRPLASNPSSLYLWQPVDNPSGYTINKVSMLSATDGWAVGNYGTILHWDGSAWQMITSPTNYSLNDIYMISPSDGWAVGGWDPVNSVDISIILHWDGATWAEVASPTPLPLNAVYMLSATEGWIVGGSGSGNVVLRWDRSIWSIVPSATPSSAFLLDVDMLSSTDGWAVGNYGTFIHWDGSTWSLVASPTTKYITSIDMLSSTDGWAVGGLYPNGEIYHWDGFTWQIVTTPTINEMFDVSVVAANDVWATSYWGGQILHWDGANWSVISTEYWARGIQMLSATDGWIMGDDILHYSEFNGLTVYVENASGLPAADAQVSAYNSEQGDYGYANTGVDGYAYISIPAGIYTVTVQSYADHFGLYQQYISSPGVLTLSAVGTPQVTLTAKQRDGTPLDQAYIVVGLANDDSIYRFQVGTVDANGVMTFSVTPGIYDVGVIDWSNYYYLYTTDQDFTVPSSTLDFDMSINPSAEVIAEHPYDSISRMSVYQWNANVWLTSFSNLPHGTSIVLSADREYYVYQSVFRNDLEGKTWSYYFSPDIVDNFFTAGEVFTFTVGGPITVIGRTEPAYIGDWITVTITPVDSFGSYPYAINCSPGGLVYPLWQVTDSNGSITNLYDNEYLIPLTAPTGLYGAHYEWDTGPYQDWLIADSQFDVLPQSISVVIPLEGGSLQSPWEGTLFEFPAGTFTDVVTVTFTMRYTDIPLYTPWVDIAHFYDITAVYSNTGTPAEPTQPYTVTVPFTDAQRGSTIVDTLALFMWDGSQWIVEPSSVVDPLNNTVVATPDHFSTWGILGETNRVYLTLVSK